MILDEDVQRLLDEAMDAENLAANYLKGGSDSLAAYFQAIASTRKTEAMLMKVAGIYPHREGFPAKPKG